MTKFVNKFILFQFIIQSWYWDFVLIYTTVNMSENSSCDTDDVSDYGDEIPPEIVEAAEEVTLNLLPDKSKRLYVSTYNNFKSWRATKKTTLFVEEVFLAYFKDISKTISPPTLV